VKTQTVQWAVQSPDAVEDTDESAAESFFWSVVDVAREYVEMQDPGLDDPELVTTDPVLALAVRMRAGETITFN